MKNILKLLGLLILFSFTQCNQFSGNIPLQFSAKMSPDDPFSSTMVPNQQFEINADRDNVVEGNGGTILIFPKGCFKNSKGEIVDGHIKIELAEALTLGDMIFSNLTTLSNGQPLITDGMIWYNATINGEHLTVNKEIPVHIEIPTNHKMPGMKAWKGTRDSIGNMNWTDPKELENYLIAVDINQLDFLPGGFNEAVANGMPYKGRKIPTKKLTDSLYYMLSVVSGNELLKGLLPTDYNEAYYNPNTKVVNGKYTRESYVANNSSDTVKLDVGIKNGIDPAKIKVISSEKYQGTLIATKEFEARLRHIYNTCNDTILELYARNVDKNMYILDSMAALIADRNNKWNEYHEFMNFYSQRLTNVKNADKYAILLRGYFDNKLASVNAGLEATKQKMTMELDKKNRAFDTLVQAYEELLFKREKFRMETYGFNWTETGWINIDTGTIPKTWDMQPLNLVVENGKQYDRLYAYIVYTSIKSIYRMNSDDNVNFYPGDIGMQQMLMPKKQDAIIITIGYKGPQTALGIRPFITGADSKLSLTIIDTPMKKIRALLKSYDDYATENKVEEDLSYMKRFYEEKQRQKSLEKESAFFNRLWHLAYPCSTYASDSEAIK